MILIKYILGIYLTFWAVELHCNDFKSKTNNEAVLDINASNKMLSYKEFEERKMSQLTEAVLNLDLSAVEIASSMQTNAIPELTELLENEDNAVRTVTVLAIGVINHQQAYLLLLKALEDDDLNVAGAAIQKIQDLGEAISVEQLVSVLDKVLDPNVLKQLVLLLGNRLDTSKAQVLVPYCQNDQDQIVVVACMAAIAKLGSQNHRDHFAKYLLSSQGAQLNVAFNLVDYINQPWLIQHLKNLLLNKTDIQSLGDVPAGMPRFIRVCDKAVVYITKLSGVSFSFDTNRHANFTEQQLNEVAIYPFSYK